jgi:hypothetical protein
MGFADKVMDSEVVDDKDEGVTLKMTSDGIPLVPQPSDDPNDPLVSSSTRNVLIRSKNASQQH